MMCRSVVLGLLCALFAGKVSATVIPNSLFTDHMVLQQGQPVPVWGTASPGEKISVALGDRAKAETEADAEGRWLATLPPLKASKEPVTMTIRGENEIRVQDVLVGEVWIGSGQSNMQMGVGETSDARRVLDQAAAGKFPHIRLFRVNWTASDQPLADAGTNWKTVSAGTLPSFSATLFYFGEALQEAMPDVPIGLISSCVGATNAHAWIPASVFESAPAAEPLRLWYQKQLAQLPQLDPPYESKLEDYEEKTAALKQAGQPLPKELQRPPEPPMGPRSKRRPTSLYNGMIAPLQPYAFQGVVWYQGENNSSLEWTGYYAGLMTALIEGWRADWARAAGVKEKREFPFLIAQLPNFQNRNVWPLLREQQVEITKQAPNAALAVLIDLGDPANIHPVNKVPAGQRLALLARAQVYGEKITGHPPLMKSAAFENGKAVVHFTQGDLASRDGQPLRNFELAGADRAFHPAQAEIQNGAVVVQSPEVPEPVAVRYAWANNPENINFTNAAGLPASPFRSDDWPWIPPAP